MVPFFYLGVYIGAGLTHLPFKTFPYKQDGYDEKGALYAFYGTLSSLLLVIVVLAFATVVFAISQKRKGKKVSPSSTPEDCNHCATLKRDISVTEHPELFDRVGFKKNEHVYASSLGEMIAMKSIENRINEVSSSKADEGEMMNIIYESYDGEQQVPVSLKYGEYSGGVTNSDTAYEMVNDGYTMTEVYEEIHWESEEGFEIYVIYEPYDEVEQAADTAISSDCVKL